MSEAISIRNTLRASSFYFENLPRRGIPEHQRHGLRPMGMTL